MKRARAAGISTSSAGSTYAGRASHNEGLNIGFFDGHVKWMRGETGDLGAPWPAANASSNVHPPREVTVDVL